LDRHLGLHILIPPHDEAGLSLLEH
jgi:hypothetical protein